MLPLLAALSLALRPPAPFTPPPPEPFSLWSIGFGLGGGLRALPERAVPDTKAPRAELFTLELRRAFPAPPPLGPSRLDLHVDWLYGVVMQQSVTRPRRAAALYATWTTPLSAKRDGALSAGLYTERGWDHYVVDEQLTRGPGGTLALGTRVGLERHRRWSDATTLGLYLSASLGVSAGSDPDQLKLARYARVGLQRTWTWDLTAEPTP